MGSIGPGELLIIALIALLLFGAGRIADIGKGLGQGISNFKKGLKEGDGEEEEEAEKKPVKKKKTEDDDVAAKKVVKTRVETKSDEDDEEPEAKPSKKVEK